MNLSFWSENGGIMVEEWVFQNFKLPLEILGTWHNIHTFVNDLSCAMDKLVRDDFVVKWRVFNSSYCYILIMNKKLEELCIVENLLDLFQLLLEFFVNFESLDCLDTLRADIQVVRPFVERLLSSVQSERCSHLYGPLCLLPDLAVVADQHILQGSLETVLHGLGVQYGCLTWSGKQVALSSQWQLLSSIEQCILTLLLEAMPPAIARDMPIYVPSISRTTPYRLLTLELMPKVTLSLICGAQSKLMDLANEVTRLWSPMSNSLRSSLSVSPVGLPPSTTLDVNVAALMLLCSRETRSFIYSSSVPVSKQTVNRAPGFDIDIKTRHVLLRKFYVYVQQNVIKDLTDEIDEEQSACSCEPMEFAVSTPEYHLCMFKQGAHSLYLLLNKSVPAVAVTSIATNTYSLLAKIKSFA